MAGPSNQTQPPPPVLTQPSLSFTQGLLVGQLSVVLLIGAFIKFFIFGEAPPHPSRNGLSNRTSSHRRSYSLNSISADSSPRTLREKPSTSNILRPVPSSSTNTRSILRKTYYSATPTNPTSKHSRSRPHHSSHQPESLDWFNVLIAQTIAQYRQTAYILKDSPTSSILASLSEALNNPEKKPSFIDSIKVTDISLGEEFPIFSNCRVIAVEDPNSDGGRLQALMDVDLSDDNLSLAVETSLLLNYPKPFSAVLPVALAVSVVRFSGTLCISFVPGPGTSDQTMSPSPSPPKEASAENIAVDHQSPERQSARQRAPHQHKYTNTNTAGATAAATADDNDTHAKLPHGIPKTSLAFSFLPDYRLDLSVRSLIGSRSRLQDVPKVAQLVEARVQAWFEERVVEPRVQVVGLPNIWPRMGRTGVRGSQEETEAGAGGSAPADIPGTAGGDGVGVRGGGGGGGVGGSGGGSMRGTSGWGMGYDGLRYRHNAHGDGGVGAGPGQSAGAALYGGAQGGGGGGGRGGEEQFAIPGSMPDPVVVT
ncbi:maintenance-mitochondrial morphology protein 1 [Blastomyces dermatitidis ER-3]|uniref:Maintenance of mitochondrial morphology protein 1 n=2 Tax=Ajellomyces dermatitidis TaxID=5039 RepID=MMM1_AJEDR|nr:maintenance-mitochondrial morphology protein 1 [Blastomyces dermatitidis ER-3]EEQ90152.2 maintenance-mitochondrial morphology protein 1 [Blastomyces dermatitidis ER-3]EGE83619.1 maintenance-mitochondrial morphology protein 1 [Blastomyces dermatitidis ATCC 18188]